MEESVVPVLEKIQNWFASLCIISRLVFATCRWFSVLYAQSSEWVARIRISPIHVEWFLPQCLKWQMILFHSWRCFLSNESLFLHEVYRKKFYASKRLKQTKNKNAKQNKPTYYAQGGKSILNFLSNWYGTFFHTLNKKFPTIMHLENAVSSHAF